MKVPLSIALVALAAVPVAAQAPAYDLALSVEVQAPAGTLDMGVVRTALAAELGVRVVDHSELAPPLGRLVITVDGSALRIAYHPAQGTTLERTLVAPADPTDRLEVIRFITANLVRDQVSELIAALSRPAPPDPPTMVATPVVVIPPIAEPPSAPVPRPVTTKQRHIPATIGLVPPLSVDRLAGSRVVVGVGVHAVAGESYGSTVASISGAIDVKRGFATGVQVGGAAAIAGRTYGAQIGGAAAVARNADGVQIGGAAAIAKTAHGLQIGGATSIAGRVDGIQIGGATSVAGRVDGIQIAGAANIASDVRGLQLGTINVTRGLRGVQLGVINISDGGDDAYPIGLLNFARKGRVEVDGWVESTRLSGVALRHGPKHIHNVFALAWSPDHDHVLAGFGLGLRRHVVGGVTLDLDAMNWWTDLWHGNLGQLEQLRATIAVPVMPSVDVFAGLAANVYISEGMQDESENFHPVIARRTSSMDGIHVVAWPSAFAGVRIQTR